MSIYNSPSPRTSQYNSSQSPKDILNDKDINSLIKKIKPSLSAKEILYDYNKELIGVLRRNNKPYFFNEEERKKFVRLYNEV
ncbi:MAG: hypothetical protein KAI79_06690 [Bacteroidales bacterium]|nr:hypothetical protein [Bacteroidales bacterium]